MIIELPLKFYPSKRNINFVRITNGTLEVTGPIGFEKLMVDLTYRIKGNTRCYYCRRRITQKNITIDHLYPRDFGGVSITNNLEPACSKCNSQKSNMNQFEYEIWRTLKTDEEKKGYYKKIIEKKKKRKKNPKIKKGYDLPKRWIEFRRLDSIKDIMPIDNSNGARYKSIMKFVKRNKKLPRPLVISANNVLLDGLTTFNVANAMKFEEVPVIVLENVVVV